MDISRDIYRQNSKISMERGIRVTRLLVPKRMRNRQKEPRITKICTSIPKYAVIANTRTVVTFIIKMT